MLEMNKREPDLLLSGFKKIDEIFRGFDKGNLYVFAGRPSMGKSTLLLNIARNVAVDYKKGVLYYNLEQTAIQVTYRLLSAESEIEMNNLRSSQLEEYEWANLSKCSQKLLDAPLYINDSHRLTVEEFGKECRKHIQEKQVDLIIIDDIQKLSLSGEQRKFAANREQEVSYIVRELKALAKELKRPILGISQLNRSVESRGGDKRPILSDLRDSGALEDEADLVAFLYRAEYYGITEDEMGNPTTGVAELIVAKHRDGALDNIELKYVSKYFKFCDAESYYESVFGDLSSSTFDSEAPGSIRLGSRMNNGEGFTVSNFDEEPPF